MVLILVIIILSTCTRNDEPTPSPSPAALPTTLPETVQATIMATGADPSSSVLFSEIVPGMPGRNNRELIELFNPGFEAIDLDGWSLWHQTREVQEPSRLFVWNERADIPGMGHYLLTHVGEEFDILPDAVYYSTMFEGKGGLTLINADGEVVDRFGWGDAPAEFLAGSPIVDFEKGNSLERLPGGDLGNGSNSGKNATDFVAKTDADPQNSGSPITPLPAEYLAIALEYPEAAQPGAEFKLHVNVENLSEDAVSEVSVSLSLEDGFSEVTLPPGAELANGRVTWSIDGIDAGETHSDVLTLSAPFANVDAYVGGYFAETPNLPRAYGPPQIMQVAGSVIPIAIARSLPEGSEVTVEGVVTMYPGGFFAGSSSAKFYVEDGTGGIQIFADGGRFDVSVNHGDLVRVSGRTEFFRDSLEVIPDDNLADIEVLENSGPVPEPTEITIEDQETDDAVLGRLNVIEGTAVRIDEFSYHYEVDLEDASGNRTMLTIEKDTGFNADPLELGSIYRASGISELVSGRRQLKPRLQSDIVEVFPPVLRLEASAPTNVMPGETMPVTITAVNHTDVPMTNVLISTEMAGGGSEQWLVYELQRNGGSKSVTTNIPVPADATGIVEIGSISAVSDQWLEPAVAQLKETFIGEGVPIWAIQGNSSRSPYIGELVTAVGAVSGVFPDMGGFFLQTLKPDGNPATADGIFVSTENLGQRVQMGDVVEVNGRVREDAGQTILQAATLSDIVVRSEGTETIFEPVVYDPPADPEEAEVYKESLEGMLVTIDQPATVVGPTNRYGEYVLIHDMWDRELVRRNDGPVGFLMWVDDGAFNAHEDQSTLPVAVSRGDSVTGVTGPLAYTFGNYKIAAIEDAQVISAQQLLPALPEAAGNQLSVATFNVENMFDAQTPHPDSRPRPSEEEYQRDLQRTAEAIVAMGAPTILALQEVENIEVLQHLAVQPQLADFNYKPVLLEGNDSRGIDVGYLIRDDRATINEFAIHDAPGELFSRPPLGVTVTIHLDSGDQQVMLLNNHFLSLSAGEVQTEPVRNNQAAWNASIVQDLQSSNPDAEIIVLGDLNSFYKTKPIETLQDAGLRHAYEFTKDGNLPYTYIYEGYAQTLDHILMSDALFQKLSSLDVLHINADYPIAHPDDNSARGVSDHDPLVAVFTYDE